MKSTSMSYFASALWHVLRICSESVTSRGMTLTFSISAKSPARSGKTEFPFFCKANGRIKAKLVHWTENPNLLNCVPPIRRIYITGSEMDAEYTGNPEYYFDLACKEQARINFFFTLDMCSISNIMATCVMVKNGHFVASAPVEEIERQPIVWGTEASGYFSVGAGDPVFCNFRSRLARIYNGPAGSMYLVFPLPETLDHQQRRFSHRIALDGDKAASFRIWHGEVEEKDEKMPVMRWHKLEPPDCMPGDISSSGLRIDMAASNPLAETIDVNDLILLRGDFGLPGKPVPLSVIALVRRKMQGQKDENIVSAGCNFLKWRKLEGIQSHKWFKPEADMGVPAIAQWVSRNFRGVRV